MRRVFRKSGLGAAAAILAAAMALAACGDGDDGGSDGGGGYGGVPDTDGEEETTTEAASATVATGETSLGEVLVDGEGMTLYLFTDDTDGTSTCYEQCEENWPPLLVEGTADVGGAADEALLGTTERDDGSTQVTYNDWPLYYWAADTAPGDVDGQGVGGVWFVLDAEGNAVETTG
ncbi:COG4315 family predicted lipoprotein [Glycomyces salinus]|uniref:COG4315 family predicted lipoprotein n=1 Tax=Glycomyces salinus TaxID=980294 RepID=UPI0018EAECAB|nr:hypothetical protein [Glycomyces salinus]